VRLPIAMAAVYVPTPRFGDDSLTDFHHGLLSLEPKHVRLGRLTSGSAPVLAAHDGADLDAVIGVVERARLERGQGLARLRFAADDPKADAVWRKVSQGILRNVSVGYKVHTFEDTGTTDGKLPVRRAVDWEPYEISVVPMGADAGAVVRSEERTTTMNPETLRPIPSRPSASAPRPS
jgi:HK97 family phage prohead protease